MPDAAEPFNVLRLVLCTQPRSNPIALGGSARMRPQHKAGFVRVDRCRERITPLNCSLNRALGLGNNLSIETTAAFAGVFLLGVMIIAAILPLLTFKA
jgi:hypothetical protein